VFDKRYIYRQVDFYGKLNTPKFENAKSALWIIAMIELFFLALAVVSGAVCGFRNSFIAFGVLGLLFGGCMVVLYVGILVFDLFLLRDKR
jgi:hypothetical protein